MVNYKIFLPLFIIVFILYKHYFTNYTPEPMSYENTQRLIQDMERNGVNHQKFLIDLQ